MIAVSIVAVILASRSFLRWYHKDPDYTLSEYFLYLVEGKESGKSGIGAVVQSTGDPELGEAVPVLFCVVAGSTAVEETVYVDRTYEGEVVDGSEGVFLGTKQNTEAVADTKAESRVLMNEIKHGDRNGDDGNSGGALPGSRKCADVIYDGKFCASFECMESSSSSEEDDEQKWTEFMKGPATSIQANIETTKMRGNIVSSELCGDSDSSSMDAELDSLLELQLTTARNTLINLDSDHGTRRVRFAQNPCDKRSQKRCVEDENVVLHSSSSSSDCDSDISVEIAMNKVFRIGLNSTIGGNIDLEESKKDDVVDGPNPRLGDDYGNDSDSDIDLDWETYVRIGSYQPST
jgi:hypothetical protein